MSSAPNRMLRLARWHAPDTCARGPAFTVFCRPVACSAPYFQSRSTRPSVHPAPSDLAPYLSTARSPLLKTHSLRPSRRTRQRLTSHDFIESARRSIPAFVPGASRRALPIKIWRQSAGASQLQPRRPRWHPNATSPPSGRSASRNRFIPEGADYCSGVTPWCLAGPAGVLSAIRKQSTLTGSQKTVHWDGSPLSTMN